jgi:hypothetical protein
MEDVFDEIHENNEHCCEGLELEMAFQVSAQGHVRGLGIDITNQDAPIFISTAQLRALADAIDAA